MLTEFVELDRLKPYPGNPRIIPEEAVAGVADSIAQFGQLQPLVITDDLDIVVGHTRLAALKRLGRAQAWCVKASNLTDAQIASYRLADNRTAEKSDWNMEALTREVQALESVPGFTDEELANIKGLEYEDPAEIPEAQPKDPAAPHVMITCPKCGHEFE